MQANLRVYKKQKTAVEKKYKKGGPSEPPRLFVYNFYTNPVQLSDTTLNRIAFCSTVSSPLRKSLLGRPAVNFSAS